MYTVHTHILCNQKLLFWMRLIEINHLTALIYLQVDAPTFFNKKIFFQPACWRISSQFFSHCFAVVETPALSHLAAVILNNGGASCSLHVLHKQKMHGQT